MNIQPDKNPRLEEVFASSTEFFKYFRDMMAVLQEDEKQASKGQPTISYLIPTIMEVDYVKSLKKPQLVFPKFSGRVILQLPKESSSSKENKSKDLLFYSPMIKIIETDLIIKLSIILKMFHSKINGKIKKR